MPDIAPLSTAYDDEGRAGVVLGAWDGADLDTGELLTRATVLRFSAWHGYPAVRDPEIATITVTRHDPPRARHNETRWVCGWLSQQRTRSLPSADREMLDVLIALGAA